MRNLLYCILVSVVLSGCAALTPAPSPQPTATPSPAPTLTPTATSPAPTRTHTPRPSRTFTPTPEPRATLPPRLISAAVSPNTAWSAAVLVVDEHYLLQVASSTVPVVLWSIPEQENVGITHYPLPLGWSEDGGLLYYTYQLSGRDGCFGSWSAHGSTVWQLDLASGETAQVADRLGHWLALSPDGSKIAFLGSADRDDGTTRAIVGVLNLATGTATSAEIAFLTDKETPSVSLDLLWSPDGKTLVFGVLTNVCGLEEELRYTIVRADAATLRQETLVLESEKWLQAVKWSEPNRVLLREWDGPFYWLDLNRRALQDWP